MTAPRLLALVIPALLLSGCFVLAPRLDPWDPEATLTLGETLVVVPAEHVAAMSLPLVVEARDAYLVSDDAPGETRTAAILGHELVTGMTREHVVYALQAHPSRIRRQGPPGGDTYLFYPHRYWVRFDGSGHLTSAGRY